MKKLKFILFAGLLVIISSAFAEDYYWVGGQGIWSDLNSWRTINGQIPNEVPDASDNVIFNENSFIAPFDTVFILTGNPTCRDFRFENLVDTVVISGGNNNSSFTIFGSITFHPKLRNEYLGEIKLTSGEMGNTITCAKVRFPGDLWFDGTGEWILQDTLFVHDSTDWKYIIIDQQDPTQANPLVVHNSGRIDFNEQTMICRGFATIGNHDREIEFDNASALMLGNWTLSAENLDFSGTNSYIYFGGEMNNFNGNDTIRYHDIDVMGVDGTIKNTDIVTKMRKVHFLGGGTVEGKKTPGIEGSFRIDTLLMEGAWTIAGPINNEVNIPYSHIHYTWIGQTAGLIDAFDSFFHRVDYECVLPSYHDGLSNEIDSIHFYTCEGRVAGEYLINHLALFNTDGMIKSWLEKDNWANHVVFGGDGHVGGINEINLLSLSSGFGYTFSADSLIHPGSIPTNTYLQTLHEVEVIGSCEGGLTFLSSYHKYTEAPVNYTGVGLSTEYLMMNDIKNIGTPWTVEKGIDLGRNTGINFVDNHEPRTLYWVGGDGLWNDITHWSETSGGIGDQCPPTVLDDVFFDANSGFTDSLMTVDINVKYACANDFTWEPVENLPTLSGQDSCNMKIWGDFLLHPSMSYLFFGKVYFESEDDDEYEAIYVNYTLELEPQVYESYDWMFNQVFFHGLGGKWRMDTTYTNYYDTTFLNAGELLLDNDTMSCLNFNATDTLQKGMYMLNKTLFRIHGYQQDAWCFNAYQYNEDPEISKTWFDAGKSTILAIGNITPPPFQPPGFCHVRTYGGNLTYWNIQFSDTINGGLRSMLKSESQCTYNLVDYYVMGGDAVGTGFIDTLTWKRVELAGGGFVSADGCKIRNIFNINFVIAESIGDTLIQSQLVDTAIFYEPGAFWGYHRVGYLKAYKYMSLDLINTVDTALFLGNAQFLGRNTFSQMTLSPNKKYIFQHETGEEFDTTIIVDDWLVYGDCDGPIRLQSDSIGTQAKILYEAQNPTYTDFTTNQTSMRDIRMLNVDGTTYIAENSVDLGNNSANWEFTNSESSVYYWIGGQGKWGDWSHWSYESGGEPISDKCTPKEINTVIFDDKSFNTPNDTVVIDVVNAYCNNMYWVHNPLAYKPVFFGPDTTSLYIYGSMQLNDSMDYAYSGEIYFDQFNDPNFVPDTITSKGHVLLNTIRFQGIDDIVLLGDDLELLVDPQGAPPVFSIAFLEHGEFNLNGYHMKTGGLYSVFKNPRTLDISDSKLTLQFDYERCWWIDADNLTFMAEKSQIFNESFLGTMMTEYGDYLEFNNVYLNGPLDSLANEFNQVEYNIVSINNEAGLVTGNFIADSVLLRSKNAAMFKNSVTNVVIIDSVYGSINNTHKINKCIVNKFGFIRGHNEFDFCVFYDDGVFMGENQFDTLVLYPGAGDFESQGNWFYFEAEQEQIVYDSLYVRGNQCSNISIASLSAPKVAFIRKDDGLADISSDFLNIISVGAISDNLEFYAGQNSTALPDPNNPPPGWIFEDSQGYIFGFDGRTERFCLGEPYDLTASNFNGDPSTLYFWEGSPVPGDINYTVNGPGTYQIRVQYFEGCYVDDFIVLEGDQAPIAVLDEGPFCEGDEIRVTVSPEHGGYNYSWFNNETTSSIIADTSYTGGIYVKVTDPTNNCKATPNQTILVKPVPRPHEYVGEEIWIKFGESVTIDAGPGGFYEWTSEPEVHIDYPHAREITVPGYSEPNPVEYTVLVENDGCEGEAFKIIGMYPPSKLGVPTAFSPNGDGENDELYVLGSGFSEIDFRVYNRYGKLVFETSDATIGWDGNYNGKKQDMEVYTYYIKVIYQDKGVVEETGNITLLR